MPAMRLSSMVMLRWVIIATSEASGKAMNLVMGGGNHYLQRFLCIRPIIEVFPLERVPEPTIL